MPQTVQRRSPRRQAFGKLAPHSFRFPHSPRFLHPSQMMHRRGAFFFPLVVLLAGASLIREAAVGVLAPVEETWGAMLARHLASSADPAPLTLVQISDDTLGKHVWPWQAQDFAVFFHAALPFEPAVIGIEPVLEFERGALAGDERGGLFEKMLHDGILRTPKLVLGARLGWSRDSDLVQELQPMPVLHHIRGDLARLPTFTAVENWAEEDYRLSTKPGWMNLPDSIGPRGTCPLLLRYRGQPVPTMALQLAIQWAKVTADEVEITLGSHIALGPAIRIPIDAEGRMRVDFGAHFDRVTYDELLLAREQKEHGETPALPAAYLRDRVLLLARSDTNSGLLTTPTAAHISPGELTAAALATIQLGTHPHAIGAWFSWLFILLTAAAAYWVPRFKSARMALLVLAAEATYLLAAICIFKISRTELPGVLPLGLILWLLLLRVFAKRIQRVIAF